MAGAADELRARGVEQVGSDGGDRRDAEQADEQRRHQRARAHARAAHEQPDHEAGGDQLETGHRIPPPTHIFPTSLSGIVGNASGGGKAGARPSRPRFREVLGAVRRDQHLRHLRPAELDRRHGRPRRASRAPSCPTGARGPPRGAGRSSPTPCSRTSGRRTCGRRTSARCRARAARTVEDQVRVVRAVVAADAGVVAADDEVRAAVVLAADRMPHRLAGPGVAHRSREGREHGAVGRVVVLEQHLVAAARAPRRGRRRPWSCRRADAAAGRRRSRGRTSGCTRARGAPGCASGTRRRGSSPARQTPRGCRPGPCAAPGRPDSGRLNTVIGPADEHTALGVDLGHAGMGVVGRAEDLGGLLAAVGLEDVCDVDHRQQVALVALERQPVVPTAARGRTGSPAAPTAGRSSRCMSSTTRS